jgi:hypothetical protein
MRVESFSTEEAARDYCERKNKESVSAKYVYGEQSLLFDRGKVSLWNVWIAGKKKRPR